jgi:hypothetical protein
MMPALGDQLRSLEAAIQRYGSSSYKAAAATVPDPNGKMLTTLTYGTFFFPSFWEKKKRERAAYPTRPRNNAGGLFIIGETSKAKG